MRVAVVGHVEWIDFAIVKRVPRPGEIVHVLDAWEEPAGGGSVAAVQLARLAGGCTFLTALGDDERGRRTKAGLEAMGVEVHVAWREEPQRRGFVYLDAAGERTITVMGDRFTPRAEDPLPWRELRHCDAVYLTAGDAGAVRSARAARRLVATVRALSELNAAHVELDALVSSANDAGERYDPAELDPAPRLVVRTDGAAGGDLLAADGTSTRWAAAALPGPPVDSYGAGDSFAAGLAYGLAEGMSPGEAVALGARCGAACVTGRGPYAGQLGGEPDRAPL
jgi:ribokinase